LGKALVRGVREVLRRLLTRRLRANPRVVKRKMSNYKAKRTHHRNWPRPTKPPDEAIAIATRTSLS
jgi:hypothetical protein